MRDTDAPLRNVICMKWGTKYGPEYVNRLYAMVRRHLTGDFRMVCLTDDSKGIRAKCSAFPFRRWICRPASRSAAGPSWSRFRRICTA
jgi:hypothetical protein